MALEGKKTKRKPQRRRKRRQGAQGIKKWREGDEKRRGEEEEGN